jgi:1-acyl-sn-glycerol-3-phosphate acyltransferase
MKRAMRIVFVPLALLRMVLILVVTAFIGLTGMIWLMLFGFSRKLQHLILRSWGKSMVFLCGIQTDRNEVPDSTHFILMPNHRSYLDIFLVAALTPAAFVAKAELKKWPFMKTGARLTNVIFVSRSDLKSLLTTMNKIRSSLTQNIPVAIFPEGTTGRGPMTKPFKKGSFKIAADAGISVIPMAIHYADENDAWIDDDTFLGHFFRQMGKPVTRVSLRYGKPVVDSDYNVLLENTKKQIEGMLDQIISEKDEPVFRD